MSALLSKNEAPSLRWDVLFALRLTQSNTWSLWSECLPRHYWLHLFSVWIKLKSATRLLCSDRIDIRHSLCDPRSQPDIWTLRSDAIVVRLSGTQAHCPTCERFTIDCNLFHVSVNQTHNAKCERFARMLSIAARLEAARLRTDAIAHG
jgi:hypothetical protein